MKGTPGDWQTMKRIAEGTDWESVHDLVLAGILHERERAAKVARRISVAAAEAIEAGP